MSQFDEFDDDDHGPEWWEPSEDAVTHAGEPVPENMVFFEPPPREIGNVISVWSSLKEGQQPRSALVQLLIAGMIAVGVALLILVIAASTFGGLESETVVLAGGFGLLVGLIAYFVVRFSHQCSYVGEHGIAIFKIKGNWNSPIKEQILVFEDAVTLNAAQTRLLGTRLLGINLLARAADNWVGRKL